MISEKEVKHIAKLARLGLKEDEIKKMQKELSKILDYVEKLQKADVSSVKSKNQSLKRLNKIENVMREDRAKVLKSGQVGKKEMSKRLLSLAPQIQNRYLKVKSIF